jgi:hypothetical protein
MKNMRKCVKVYCEEHGKFRSKTKFKYCPYCGKELIVGVSYLEVKHRQPKEIKICPESENTMDTMWDRCIEELKRKVTPC